MARFPSLSAACTAAFLSSFVLFNIIPSVRADSPVYIQGTNAAGQTEELLDSRTPALFTGDFGDCMGGQSLINVTEFDAAYYKDNMTVLFHLAGLSSLQNESIMIHIAVNAYGEDRFDMTFNPCDANFASLCPMNSSIPIYGEAIIPVSSSDVASIIPIALVIPDFEGSATLRVFSNSTETEIACFQAVMRNGHSFSHPQAVGSVTGVFTLVAVLSSFATAIYGVNVPEIRTHYAHSLSVLVVFEVFQSVFFSGALSLNWPSVCAAFWSNFAWSAGMIYTPSMITSINKFTGLAGNSSQVGNAGSSVLNNNGGLQQQIYGRSVKSLFQRALEALSLSERDSWESLDRGNEMVARMLKRDTTANTVPTNGSKGYNWAGEPSRTGLLIPGNWSGFAGDLMEPGIPAADAFMVGFLWFLILVVILVAATVAFKWGLEAFSKMRWMKEDRLALFRSHWLKFVGLIVLRAMMIGFFMMMTLSLFQFSSGGKAGPIAIAVIVFLIFFTGMLGLACYACFFRAKFGRYESTPDRIHFQPKRVMKIIPWFSTARQSNLEEGDKARSVGSISFFRIDFVNKDAEKQNIHEDEGYTIRFGWLSSRFRRTRWWFFAFWIVYQFVRACFIGGASANPKIQVIGLLVVEFIAFVLIIKINPFEGSRNTALAVYMLGISKVATAGLSIAFLDEFNLGRILTTVIGVIIIVIQGFLIIGLLILIVLGAISSYMSVMRNREEFKPRRLSGIQTKYIAHIEQKATDLPPPPPPEPEEPKEPYFSVNAVRRAPKIEDEDVVPDMVPEMNPAASQFSLGSVGRAARSRTNTMKSGNVPYGARVHRASWSSRDFQNWQQEELARGDSPLSAPSINHSGHNTANNSVSVQPLVRPQISQSSLRPMTPTKEQQKAFADQRVVHAK